MSLNIQTVYKILGKLPGMLIIFNAVIYIQKGFFLLFHLVPHLFQLAFLPYSKGSKRNAQCPKIPPKGGFTLLSINMSVCLSHLGVLSVTFSFCLLLCPVLVLLSMTHNPFISLCIPLSLCVAGYSCPVLLTVLCPAVTFRGRVFQLVLRSKHVI